MAFKVFTNGSTLQASEVNDNLMRQAVSTFSNAAARTAAITAPSEGMLTWLEDVNRYESYNGSSWVSPFGMTHVATVSFSNAASAQISNVFTSEFTHYKAFISIQATAGNPDLQFRFRDGSGDVSTALYNRQVLLADSTTLTAGRVTLGTLGILGILNNIWNNTYEVTIFNPFAATNTSVHSEGFSFQNGAQLYQSVTNFGGVNSFTGFSLFGASANMNGSVRVYGMRNA